MADLVSLRFVKRHTPYSAGVIAGFKPGYAQRLVAAGEAVYVNPPPGLDERGKPIKKEPEPPKKAAPKKKADEKDEIPEDRKSGKLGTVKK